MSKIKGQQINLPIEEMRTNQHSNRSIFTASGITDDMKSSLAEIAARHGYKNNVSALIRALAIGDLEIKPAADYIKNAKIGALEQEISNLTISHNRLAERLMRVEDALFARDHLS